MTAQIQSLFPTPVLTDKFKTPFVKKEKDFIQSHAGKVIESNFNNISKDKYILEYMEMGRIRKFIEENIKTYLKQVVCADDKVSLRITQSWLNYTESGRSHHRHTHPNSYISGVFYFNADPELDRIYFLKEDYKQILVNPQTFNHWNSTSWWLPVGTGDLLIFPSSLMHMVDNTVSKETRISLSFNTFPVGMIGNETNADALHLKE
jgi:uncharacterized protein (TIGR02466 family)